MAASWVLSFSLGMLTGRRLGERKLHPSAGLAAPQPESSFLSLPVELRMVIYTYLFHLSDSGLIMFYCHNRRHSHPPSVLSILQTCRQVLQEAEEIFYAVNRFRYNPSTTHRFLSEIGTTRRNAVTSVSVVAESGLNAYHLLPQMSRIPHLRSIHIQRILSVRFLNLAEWTGMIQHIRKILAQMQHLEEVKMITPPAKGDLAEWEKERLVKLQGIDARLENFRNPFGPL